MTDFLSGTNNELMAYEKGFGAVKTVFGHGYERLNQQVLPDQDGPQTLRKAIAASGGGKVWFQSDLYGSPLFAANEQGDVQRFAQRSVWGELRLPQQEDINAAGMENNLRFTSFCFDPAAGVYFAHARFYDAGQGRMFGRDPMKRGVNAYPYCDNDPVNHVDPTGEIPTILAGGLIGGVVGALGGFVGSAVSQYTNGEKFSVKKAIGSAANGAIVGAARGAMVGSGIGAVGAFAVNFGAGALGSAAEQKISTGKVSFGDSMVGGLINGVSGAIYGNNPLGSVKSAFGRGALAGGATAGINNLYNVYKNWKTAENGNRGDNLQSGYGWLDGYSYGLQDPRGACGTINPLMGLVSASFRKAVGYAYKSMNQERQVKKKSGFDVKSFVTDVAIGSFTGGAGSVMFYGADKMASALRGSIRGNKGGSKPIAGDINYMPENEAFYKNALMRKDIDANGYLDVIAHGNRNKIKMFVNGRVMEVDHRVASRLISNSPSYSGQNIKLLSCNTGAVENGFAQNLANKMNVLVSAPNNYLWAYPNGNMIVAGRTSNNLPDFKNLGRFIDFIPGH